ncbi:DIS3-like exonuclease 2 [Ischnura elegans]|uniref:DIS3-like exonuclease 2 n=1 Tax=Ischnura elegans TaxID=197161 RepID=UPI001ED8B2D1|nr:DIS3-like exonuclease 2 [Ischnura elegans]
MNAKEMDVSNPTHNGQIPVRDNDTVPKSRNAPANSSNSQRRKKKKPPKPNGCVVNVGNPPQSSNLAKESLLQLERHVDGISTQDEGHAGPSTSAFIPAVNSPAKVPTNVVPSKKRERRRGQNSKNDNAPVQGSPVSTVKSTGGSVPQLNMNSITVPSPANVDSGPSPSGSGVANSGSERRKGRYAKKKAAAMKENAQQQSPVPLPSLMSLNSVESFIRGTPPQAPFVAKTPRRTPHLPGGAQPLNYLRPVVPARPPMPDKPKQEKFLPYWPDDAVEAGLQSGLLMKGVIRINPRNYQKAYISQDDDEEAKDVLIDGIMDRNRALEGDEVAIKLHEEAQWVVEEGIDGENVVQKTGMVVAILEKKHNRYTVGFLKLVAKSAKSNTPRRHGRRGGTPKSKSKTPSSQPEDSHDSQADNSVLKNFIAQMSPSVLASPGVDTSSFMDTTAPDEETLNPEELPPEELLEGVEEQMPDPLPDEIISQSEHPELPTGTPVDCEILSPPTEDEAVPPAVEVEEQSPPSQAAAENLPEANAAENPEKSSDSKVKEWKMPDMVLFSPRDARMPRMWISTRNLPSGTPSDLSPSNCQDHLFLACIWEWNEQPIAKGTLLAYVGEADEVESETAALLLEHNLDVTPFPEDHLKLPPLPFQIPQKELDERLDLRKMCIFTIDPATAKDLDDALSVRKVDDHHLEIGVHIADPSFFLEEDSELDVFVRNRATSIYLVQQVFHMLPKDLCMLCSLLPGEDKLAFSLMMEVDMNTWTVTSHKFSRSIIRSCAQLSYEHAQAFMDNPDGDWSGDDFPPVHNGYNINDLCRAVNMIRPFSAVLRERRFAFNSDDLDEDSVGFNGGALRINQPKLYFKLDHATCMPREVFVYENKESHRLIEELMLLANILTAQRLFSTFPKHAFLRRHRRPKMKMLNNLAQELTHYGIHISTSSAGALHASLQQYGLGCLENEEKSDGVSAQNRDEGNFALCQYGGDGEDGKSAESLKPLEAQQMGIRKENVEEGDSTGKMVEIENLGIDASPLPSTSDKVPCILSANPEVEGLKKRVDNLNLETDVNSDDTAQQFVRECDFEVVDNVCYDSQSYMHETSVEVRFPKDKTPSRRREKVVKSRRKSSDSFSKNFVPAPTSMPQNEEDLAKARDLVLNHLCAKPMVRADYYCLGAGIEKTANKNMTWKLDCREEEEDSDEVYTRHYALNVPLYTHFTSPIRRYADIMVHRLLAASLGYAPAPTCDPLSIQKIANNCNAQNHGAKRASEASNELFFRLWIRLQVEQEKRNGMSALAAQNQATAGDSEESRSEGGIRETAVVVNAKDYSFDAILIKFGVLVRVYVNKLPAAVRSYKKHGTNTISILWFLPGHNCATRTSPRQDITMFSVVDVMIYYSYSMRKIRAELVSPFAAVGDDAK